MELYLHFYCTSKTIFTLMTFNNVFSMFDTSCIYRIRIKKWLDHAVILIVIPTWRNWEGEKKKLPLSSFNEYLLRFSYWWDKWKFIVNNDTLLSLEFVNVSIKCKYTLNWCVYELKQGKKRRKEAPGQKSKNARQNVCRHSHARPHRFEKIFFF